MGADFRRVPATVIADPEAMNVFLRPDERAAFARGEPIARVRAEVERAGGGLVDVWARDDGGEWVRVLRLFGQPAQEVT